MIAPSLLAANFYNLANDVEMLNNSEADWLHLDIMDGHFVPNISFGFPIISSLKKHTDLPFDVHLMITDPDKYIQKFKDVGADIITVHYEACPHLHRTIQAIKSMGVKAGVSLNPHTPINVLTDIINSVDMVLIMSVNPGFGGQSFIENTYSKLNDLKALMEQKNCKPLVQVDGGVNIQNAGKLYEHGADVLVAGSSVFKAENPIEAIKELRKKN